MQQGHCHQRFSKKKLVVLKNLVLMTLLVGPPSVHIYHFDHSNLNCFLRLQTRFFFVLIESSVICFSTSYFKLLYLIVDNKKITLLNLYSFMTFKVFSVSHLKGHLEHFPSRDRLNSHGCLESAYKPFFLYRAFERYKWCWVLATLYFRRISGP